MFKYIDRGYKNWIVLIPGWATDYRIFDHLDIDFNYLIPVDFYPFDFESELLSYLKENEIKKISLFGWSLGGFAAVEVAYKYPDLIDELILIGIRKKYRIEELEKIKNYLQKNKKGYLYKFYTECFCSKEEMQWFKENLLKKYCEELSLDYLLKTLDYLANAEINIKFLNKINSIKILHGEYDNIAPIKEAIEIKNSLRNAEFICIKDAGHAPFFKKDFSKYLCLPRYKFYPVRNNVCKLLKNLLIITYLYR